MLLFVVLVSLTQLVGTMIYARSENQTPDKKNKKKLLFVLESNTRPPLSFYSLTLSH